MDAGNDALDDGVGAGVAEQSVMQVDLDDELPAAVNLVDAVRVAVDQRHEVVGEVDVDQGAQRKQLIVRSPRPARPPPCRPRHLAERGVEGGVSIPRSRRMVRARSVCRLRHEHVDIRAYLDTPPFVPPRSSSLLLRTIARMSCRSASLRNVVRAST